MFFKSNFNTKLCNWKRLNFFILRRRFFKKKFKLFKKNKNNLNFFFKKNLFSFLLKIRKFFSFFFFSKKYKRQYELTKFFTKLHKFNNLKKSPSLLSFFLLRSQFFFFIGDIIYFLKKNFISLNRVFSLSPTTIVSINDVIQLQIRPNYFIYFKKIIFFFKIKLLENKKLKKLFYLKNLKNLKNLKKKSVRKKKKIKSFFNLFSSYKFDLPKFLEIDFLTLTIFFLNTPCNFFFVNNFLFYRIFNTDMFSLLNFKKIN